MNTPGIAEMGVWHRILKSTVGATLLAIVLLGPSIGVSSEPDEEEYFVVTPVQEKVMGDKSLRKFLDAYKVSEDGNLLVRIDSIGRRVTPHSDRPNLTYRFIVIQGTQLQAYSFSNGTVCLTDLLVRILDDDDELAFALAHEIAHIVQRHWISQARSEVIAEDSPKKQQEVIGSLTRRLIRDAEMAADRYGALYAVRAGFRYTASYEALQKLAKADNVPTTDDSHPDYRVRIEALKAFRVELELVLQAFDRGLRALQEGKPEVAIAEFETFVAEFPSSASGQTNLGAAHLAKLRKQGGTPGDLIEVLPILPDPGVSVRGPLDKVTIQQAETHFKKAISLNPDDAVAYGGLAMVLVRRGDYDRAKKTLEAGLEIDPQNRSLLLCMGNVHYVAEDLTGAESFYLRALLLNPDWEKARINLAMTYERMGRHEEACDTWRVLVDSVPNANTRFAALCTGN